MEFDLNHIHMTPDNTYLCTLCSAHAKADPIGFYNWYKARMKS